jgi:hypothetical protein
VLPYAATTSGAISSSKTVAIGRIWRIEKRRGLVELKGKSKAPTFLLEGRRTMRPPERTVCRPFWVKNGGSGLVRRPSGLPSIADVLPHRREPPLRADFVAEVRF